MTRPKGWYVGRAGQLRRKVASWMLDRQGVHIPVGLAVSWLLFLYPLDVSPSVQAASWIAGMLVFVGFILYEITEDHEINDEAYRDIQGFTIGLGAGAVAQILLRTLGGV